MSFKIHPTNNGPVIMHNDKIVVLSDDDGLIGLCEESLEFLAAMQGHILKELDSAMKSFYESVELNFNIQPTKIYSYLSAFQQFWMFRNHVWPAYLTAVEEANSTVPEPLRSKPSDEN